MHTLHLHSFSTYKYFVIRVKALILQRVTSNVKYYRNKRSIQFPASVARVVCSQVRRLLLPVRAVDVHLLALPSGCQLAAAESGAIQGRLRDISDRQVLLLCDRYAVSATEPRCPVHKARNRDDHAGLHAADRLHLQTRLRGIVRRNITSN